MSFSSKRILIISPFFYPEPISTGKYNTSLALALRKKNHTVTLLCFHPFYPEWTIKKSHRPLKKIKIIRGGKNLKFSKITLVRRIILEFGFAFFVLRKIRTVQKNQDIIISIFPPSLAFYSVLLFLNKKTQKIGIVHDLQEIYSVNKKGLLHRIVTSFIHKIEKKCFNFCDKLIFLSNEMKNEAQKLYHLNISKLNVQYPFITLSDRMTNNLSTVLKTEHINVVYSGALGEKQNPKGLYRFFDDASDKIENVVFHFFSQGELFNQLKATNRNNKIKFHNLVCEESLNELYQRSDVQILPQLPNTSVGSLPSKLPNLLASGCKILVITDKNSELEILFKAQKLKTVINSWNHNIVLNALKTIICSTYDSKHQKKVAKQLFTVEKMIYKILD